MNDTPSAQTDSTRKVKLTWLCIGIVVGIIISSIPSQLTNHLTKPVNIQENSLPTSPVAASVVTQQQADSARTFWSEINQSNTAHPWASVVPDSGFIRVFIEGRGDLRETSVDVINEKLNNIITSTSTSVLEMNGKVPWNEVLRLIHTCQISSYSDYNIHSQINFKEFRGENYSTNATYSMIEDANRAASSTCGGMFPMSHF